MTIGVGIHWRFRVLSDTDLFQVGDELTELLLAAEKANPAVVDSAVSVDRGEGAIEIEVCAIAGSHDEAVAAGQAAINDALPRLPPHRVNSAHRLHGMLSQITPGQSPVSRQFYGPPACRCLGREPMVNQLRDWKGM